MQKLFWHHFTSCEDSSYSFIECEKRHIYIQFCLGVFSGTDPSSVEVTGVWSGRLAGSSNSVQCLVGALESRCTTQAKKVEETKMRRRPLSLCCQTVLSTSDFLAPVILIFPPSFCQALNRLVIPVFSFGFFLYIVIWGKWSSICSCQSSFGLLLFRKIYKSVWRIIIFKQHIWMPKCVQTISVNATCLRLI